MAPGARMSVAEAAELLGVHPQRVHQRIRAGSLPAEKVGSQWIVDEDDVRRVKRNAGPGRPLSRKSAWDLIAVAASNESVAGNESVAALSPSARSRARSRVRSLAARASSDKSDLDAVVVGLSHAMRNRAQRRLFVASPIDLPDLRDDDRVHLSGISHPESNLAAGDLVEGYVAGGVVDALVDDYLLSPSARSRANVILHVVPEDLEHPAYRDLDVAVLSPLVLAADLAEYDGVRERSAAVDLVAELHQRLAAEGVGSAGAGLA